MSDSESGSESRITSSCIRKKKTLEKGKGKERRRERKGMKEIEESTLLIISDGVRGEVIRDLCK